jgi:hypothetical protein
VIISDAMTSVYMVIAVWMPATVVPTSLATVAIDTFITELSSVMRNCADANVSRIVPDASAARSVVTVTDAPSHRPRRPGYLAGHGHGAEMTAEACGPWLR